MNNSETKSDGIQDRDGAMFLLDSHDVARILKISSKTVHKLVREGKLPCVQLTIRERRFTLEQVQQYVQSRSTEIRFDKKASPTVSSHSRKGGEKSRFVGVSGKDLRKEMKKWR